MPLDDAPLGWLIARALVGLPCDPNLVADCDPAIAAALAGDDPKKALAALPRWRELAALAARSDPEGDQPAKPEEEPIERPPGDPHWYATEILDLLKHADGPKLRRWQEQWWEWSEGEGWRMTANEELVARVNRTCRTLADYAQREGLTPKTLTVGPACVTATTQAILSQVILKSDLSPGSWLDGRESCPMVPFENGMARFDALVQGDESLTPHTPAYWTHHRLAFPLVPGAECPAWLEFLCSIWPDDAESIETLQDWFGWCLCTETTHHKMLCLLGPRRAGKGTIAHVLQAIVGESRTVNPTLGGLRSDFGIEALLGKSLAVFSDARMPSGDVSAITERLLSLISFDRQSVDRKYKPFWHGQIPIRLMLVANDLPAITDTSLALVGRMVVLPLRRSWYGAEDLTLLDRLQAELPGILRWSVEGLRRLHTRGRFLQPRSGQLLVDELAELASPVEVFANDALFVAPGAEVECQAVFSAWKRWNEERGAHKHGTIQWLGRQLRSVLPSLERRQSRDSTGKRHWNFVDLAIRPGYGEGF